MAKVTIVTDFGYQYESVERDGENQDYWALVYAAEEIGREAMRRRPADLPFERPDVRDIQGTSKSSMEPKDGKG
jgi:hypothetical protein